MVAASANRASILDILYPLVLKNLVPMKVEVDFLLYFGESGKHRIPTYLIFL
jgi:hypothetical protein